MIRKLKRAIGIRFSMKALARNPNIYLRQSTIRFRSFHELVLELITERPVSIIQIGANDGVTNDPLGELIPNYPERVRGLLIEPQRSAFGRLSRRYADAPHITCLRAAIDRKSGTRCIYSIDRQAAAERLRRSASDGIASFDRRHVETILKANSPALSDHEVDELITEEMVPVTTLGEALLGAGISQPDVFLVDTEGFDAEIMHIALDDGVRPTLVQYEHKHLTNGDRRGVSKRLMREGYRLWADHADVWGRRDETTPARRRIGQRRAAPPAVVLIRRIPQDAISAQVPNHLPGILVRDERRKVTHSTSAQRRVPL